MDPAPAATQDLPAVPDFIATCWSTAGDVVPGRGSPLSPLTFEERVAAAAAAGYRGFGIGEDDLLSARDRLGYARMAQLLDDHGMRHRELEYLQDWWAAGVARQRSDAVRALLLEAAGELGAHHLKVGLGEEPPASRSQLQEEMGSLADQAARAGTLVAFEPPAGSFLPTLADGAALLREVDHPGAGMMVDVWHVQRSGQPNTSLPAALAGVPVVAVEVSDGAAEPVGTLFDDTFDHRLLPGEGDFDVVTFIAAVDALGYRGPWGLEVMSARLRAMPVRESTRLLVEAARRAFSAARSAG